MIFKIKERLILLQILPTQGSLSEMVEIMDLAKQLKLNDEEKNSVSFNEDSKGNITWDIDKDPNIDITISSDIIKILKETINKLDKDKKITPQLVDLAIKITKL